MATDPKKDEFKDSDITDEQLENVAGGAPTGVPPKETIFPTESVPGRPGGQKDADGGS